MTMTDVTVSAPVAAKKGGSGPGRDALPPELIDELMAKVKSDGVQLLGDGGLIAEFSKRILERALDEELTDELGYERGDPAGRGSGNSRNGTTPKTVITEIGAVKVGAGERLGRAVERLRADRQPAARLGLEVARPVGLRGAGGDQEGAVGLLDEADRR